MAGSAFRGGMVDPGGIDFRHPSQKDRVQRSGDQTQPDGGDLRHSTWSQPERRPPIRGWEEMDGVGWAGSKNFDDSPPTSIAPKRMKLEPQEASTAAVEHQRRAAWQVGERAEWQGQAPWMVDVRAVKVETRDDQPWEMQVPQHRLLHQGNGGWWDKRHLRETPRQGLYQRFNSNNSPEELGDERSPEQQVPPRVLEPRQLHPHRGASYRNTNPRVQQFAFSEQESMTRAPALELPWEGLPSRAEVGALRKKPASGDSERGGGGHVGERQETGR